jgi:hypothetical protein
MIHCMVNHTWRFMSYPYSTPSLGRSKRCRTGDLRWVILVQDLSHELQLKCHRTLLSGSQQRDLARTWHYGKLLYFSLLYYIILHKKSIWNLYVRKHALAVLQNTAATFFLFLLPWFFLYQCSHYWEAEQDNLPSVGCHYYLANND